MTLFEASEKEEAQRFKLIASIFGAEPVEGGGGNRGKRRTENVKDDNGKPFFQHPDVYTKWTPEQKRAETQRLMGILRPWAEGTMPTEVMREKNA